MDQQTQLRRLGNALREARRRRGLTQAELARLARLPRLKVIQVEKGTGSVSVGAYARIAGALGTEFTVIPARRPTLEEVRELFAHD